VARFLALVFTVVVAALAATPAWATAPTAKEKTFEKSLVYRTGTVTVRDTRIVLPPGFRYLNATDAQRTLTDLYGNPPHPEVRALILPPKSGVLDNKYFIVATYENDGHISDSDAAKIDYDAMLQSMQKSEKSDNAKRAKAGYEPIHMVGWADRPHYEASTHKLYWASDLVFGTDKVDTLNYEVRTLGREGMLALNAVASKPDIATVRSGMQTVLGASRFVGGRRYEDYHHGDKVSKLTIAAVVAGGGYAAAKTGLIALLIAKLKFVAVGFAALVAALRKRLFRRSSQTDPHELD
jgi:uncharacterized membrane-anchored protein